MDDRELVLRLRAGDEDAAARFVDLYEEKLYRTAVHFLGYSDPDAEDIVQQVFSLALGQLADFRFQASLYTWLNRICVNLCYERIRQRQKVLQQQDDAWLAALKARDMEAAAAGLDLERRSSRLGLLPRALQGLSRGCRQLLEWREIEGLSYAELGQRLKLPLGTIMSRLSRCRESLRKLVLTAEADDA